MNSKNIFPPNFLWGTSTSAHQVEGDNKNNDFWIWEKRLKRKFRSGIACNQYVDFKNDFRLARKVLNNNSHRISIEWSRIEPEEGKFNKKEINHYKRVIKEMRSQNLEPLVTLHHFTNPIWISQTGGWTNKNNIKYFIRYAALISKEFSHLANNWLTINEANVYPFLSYVAGIYPPNRKNLIEALKVYFNMANAHKKVYEIIHKDNPNSFVGMAVSMSDYKGKGLIEKLLVPIVRWISNYSFIYITHGYHDYIGINHYLLYILNLKAGFNITPRKEKGYIRILDRKESDIGWLIYPKGIYNVIKRTWNKYKIPIIITENGIADISDQLRQRYLVDYLTWVKQAIDEGMDIRGYFHWSLLDNIEWGLGRTVKFGLFKTNFTTMERVPRKSALIYAKIAKENRLDSK